MQFLITLAKAAAITLVTGLVGELVADYLDDLEYEQLDENDEDEFYDEDEYDATMFENDPDLVLANAEADD